MKKLGREFLQSRAFRIGVLGYLVVSMMVCTVFAEETTGATIDAGAITTAFTSGFQTMVTNCIAIISAMVPIAVTFFPLYFPTGYYFSLHDYSTSTYPFSIKLCDSSGKIVNMFQIAEHGTFFFGICDWLEVNSFALFFMGSESKSYRYVAGFRDALALQYFGYEVNYNESLSLDVSETMQQVLDRLTALEEGQSIALDVGAAQSMEIQEILQGILDAILAGDLAASAEVVDTAEVPVEPPEEPDPPVVPEVPEDLDKLGTALTSRFPFSIPWDVYKGVKLLAAPAKAPYFEVDFMAPIAHRVGGWKGSTKIVLDFSEYEIIGQVCRWTSTIGFCLMLASGTKRLIWTA